MRGGQMNDRENMELIRQALRDYEDGSLVEARDELAKVVERIDAFIVAEEIGD